MQAASKAIRDDYAQTIQGIVSASDAEKILAMTPQRGAFLGGPAPLAPSAPAPAPSVR
jgi:hypothetical protein